MSAFLTAFLFTQAVEVPIYKRRFNCSFAAAFGASAITHPIVWFVFFSPRWQLPYLATSFSAECFAWLAEAAYFAFALGYRRVLAPTLIANLASVAAGVFSRAVFGAP